jgi:hypothetical protein
MKIFTSILVFLSWFTTKSFSQDKSIIAEINKFIQPAFFINSDTSLNYQFKFYKQVDLDGDRTSEIIVVALDTLAQENKIFIFKKTDKQLQLVDSSAAYEVDGRGPQIILKNNALEIYHAFHHGSYDFVYEYSKGLQKFELASISLEFNNPYFPDTEHGVLFYQKYDALKHTLHLHSYLYTVADGEKKEIKSKDKTIVKNIELKRDLSSFKDPIESSENDDIFITEGSLYDEMMKY